MQNSFDDVRVFFAKNFGQCKQRGILTGRIRCAADRAERAQGFKMSDAQVLPQPPTRTSLEPGPTTLPVGPGIGPTQAA